MNVKEIHSWNEFVEAIEYLNGQREDYISKTPATVSEFIFRGQSDLRWKLETTLERFVRAGISLLQYYDFVSVIKSKIESITDNQWIIPSRDKYTEWCTKQDSRPLWSFPGADYFAYLRHHGFPSPLLDWTRSPFIAAYFAMIGTPKDGVEKVSIYAYLEFAGIKINDVKAPYIESLGQYLKTHKRHYVQQSTYTICTNGKGSQIYYDNHENVVSLNSDRQDILWRLDVPIGERHYFLAKLELMNINSFSLFQTEDKLMEHIYISDILLGKHLK
jgi:hypothetical protein